MPERPEKQTVNPVEILKNAPVNTVEVAPVAPSLDCTTFMGQDGRTYYKYKIDEDTVVFPKPIEQMSEQDFYDLPVTSFNTQTGRIPNNLTVEFNETHLAGYWVNYSYNNGIRVSELRARGFVPAKKEDMKFICIGTDDSDGCVRQESLILMKIHKAKLFMRYKEFMDIARMRGGTDKYRQVAEASGRNRYTDFYLTPQAKHEFQGLGPVQQIPEFRQENQ